MRVADLDGLSWAWRIERERHQYRLEQPVRLAHRPTPGKDNEFSVLSNGDTNRGAGQLAYGRSTC